MKDVSAASSQIRGLQSGFETTRTPASNKGVSDTMFRDKLEALKGTMPSMPTPNAKANVNASALKFSNHAVERMQSRGIHFSPEDMQKIESAVGKAQSKGAQNTLLLTDQAAMIVSMKDKTVVTVMDKANLKENVFTNIDSTVMV